METSMDVSELQGYDAANLEMLGGENGEATERKIELGMPAEPRLTEASDNSDSPEKEKKGPSQATLLVKLSQEAKLFHSLDDKAYVTVQVKAHHETMRVRGSAFRRWLARLYYLKCKASPGSQAIADALNVLGGKALHDGDAMAVHVRVARHNDSIYVDLCDDEWRAIQVDADGWRVVAEPPVKFRRARAMLPLPMPVAGGSLTELRKFVNVTDADWPLLVGWLVAALRDTGPYPMLALHGEQGSAKSTTARVLRSLVDPNTAAIRSEPRNAHDLAIAAGNGWVTALDNLSHVQLWLSDALCRLSTGGGFATRELYTDGDEVIFDAQRPTIITGITELATRGDLVDRCLLLNLPTIPTSKRKTESDFWRDFDAAKPRLFGALLTAVSTAKRNLPTVEVPDLPRMADFAEWVVAAEPALGLEPGEFLEAYRGNREAANDLALEASPVAKVLRTLLAETEEWTGTATNLLGELDRLAGDREKRLKSWPQTARGLAGVVRRLAPNLRADGVDVEFHLDTNRKRTRLLSFRIVRDSTVRTVRTVRSSTLDGVQPSDRPSEPSDLSSDRPTDRPTKSVKNPGIFNHADGADGVDAKIRTCSKGTGKWGEL